MMHTTITPKLPAGMALIETAEGRWFPALTPLTDTPHWVTVIDEGAAFVPPAREPRSRPGPKKPWKPAAGGTKM